MLSMFRQALGAVVLLVALLGLGCSSGLAPATPTPTVTAAREAIRVTCFRRSCDGVLASTASCRMLPAKGDSVDGLTKQKASVSGVSVSAQLRYSNNCKAYDVVLNSSKPGVSYHCTISRSARTLSDWEQIIAFPGDDYDNSPPAETAMPGGDANYLDGPALTKSVDLPMAADLLPLGEYTTYFDCQLTMQDGEDNLFIRIS